MPLFNWIPKKNSWFWVRVDLESNIRHRVFIADFLCASLVVNSQCAIFLLMVLPRTHSFSIIAATITLRVIRGILIAKLFCSNVISTLKQFPIFERCVWKKIALHQKGVFSILIHLWSWLNPNCIILMSGQVFSRKYVPLPWINYNSKGKHRIE